MNLDQKSVLVTGGGSGIGLAIARAMHHAGAHVVITGRDMGKLDRARDELSGITAIRADLTDRAEREQLITAVLAAGRTLDILVNNAGIMQYFELAADRALDRLDDELELDLHAPIHLATALLPHLLTRPEAAIVNVTTGLIYAPFGRTPGYSAAKAGLHAFTRSLRWQTRATRLKVVELMPPAVETELTRRYDGAKIKPDRVAADLMHALANDRDNVRPGQTKALYAMSRMAPDFMFRTLNKLADRTELD